MGTTATRWPRIEALFGAGLGFASGIVATIASSMTVVVNPLTMPVIAVAIVSAMTTVAGALLAGLQSWLLYASFVLGHTGQLAVNAPSLRAAVVLAGTALIATTVGAAIRWIQQPAVPCASQPHEPNHRHVLRGPQTAVVRPLISRDGITGRSR